MSKEIAQSVGLWLAEGDSKSCNEITFTNNCFELIKLFDKALRKIFQKEKFNVRLYVYTPDNKKPKITLKFDKINYYQDKRATKPYYIWRLASVELLKKWKQTIESVKNNKKFHVYLLQGFFAGEGNIKTGAHNNRQIRITQNKRVDFIEEFLKDSNIPYKFEKNHGNGYIIHGRNNWDRLAKIKIADLHPERKIKFWEAYNEFKQYHYKKGYLKKQVFKLLRNQYTNEELSIIFKRTKARIYDVLEELKKENKITNFRVKSKDYWIRVDANSIIISDIKKKYLDVIEKGLNTTKDISTKLKVSNNNAFKRLGELRKLKLIDRKEDKTWIILPNKKRIIVMGRQY